MKLVLLYTLLVIFVATICGQKFQQEGFQFPSFFSTPSSTLFTSDSSIYLQPRTQTPIPYLNMNNMNKLPFQLLPTTGTKAAPIFPTSSSYMSSTWSYEDEEESGNDHNEISNNLTPVSNKLSQNPANNITENTILGKSETKSDAKMVNQHTQLQRFDVKPPTPIAFRSQDIAQTKSLSPASRRMIVTSEIQRTDQGPDLVKASSYQNSQYVQAPGDFISSTSEPAIPILRLSSEMDLDGSFSYEALGADQTHYVQHSRMENIGTDKEEQIVEGSYSYIGDDGRTYTVHYIADSNGFRATGDHLPVPPPIPEIIQRALQYNLAEDAKKPAHLRSSWENENERNKEFEINERNIYVPRNLFTGKTPEAFSYGFSHGSNGQNNLISGGNFQVPTKSNYEILIDESTAKINSMPIAPQVTFLASQGAHNPSTPVHHPTKVTNPEKSSLPQLINYEAETKNSDQEASKALWRWQYDHNANTNQNPKNSISRSSSDGDDVIINFNDMTPEQYTHMMQTDILSQSDTVPINKYSGGENDQLIHSSQYFNKKTSNIPERDNSNLSTENIELYNYETDGLKESQKLNNNFYGKIFKQEDKLPKTENIDTHSELISHQNFTPQNGLTNSYDLNNTSSESSKIIITDNNLGIQPWQVPKLSHNDLLSIKYNKKTTAEPVFNTPLNIGINDENTHLKSITYNSDTEMKEDTTTERTIEEMMKENIFLRNIFKQPHNKEKETNKPFIEHHKQTNNDDNQDKSDKDPKYLKLQSSHNNINIIKSKPLDVNNILNYVIMKNHFESIKTKQNKPAQYFNKNKNIYDKPVQYIPIKQNTKNDVETNNDELHKQDNDYQTLDQQQQQELQGIIKNYKVLQRKKNAMQRSQVLSEPQRHIKTFPTQGLPPLGRAGPSMKSYLPPTYL